MSPREPAPIQPEEQVVTCPVIITDALKQAATEANVPATFLDSDFVQAAHIESAVLKYDSLEAAQQVARAVHAYLQHLKDAQVCLQAGNAKVYQDDLNGCVKLPFDLLLTAEFNDLIADVAKTGQELLEVDRRLLDTARKYADAFPTAHLVCIDLIVQEGQEVSHELRVCEEVVQRRHKVLHNLAKALLMAAVTGPHHQISVYLEEVAKVRVHDGHDEIDFGKSKAAVRALLTLALLRRQPSFTAREFVTFYRGKEVEDPGKSFGNGLKELADILGHVTWNKGEVRRVVTGLVWKQLPSDEQMRQILSNLYNPDNEEED